MLPAKIKYKQQKIKIPKHMIYVAKSRPFLYIKYDPKIGPNASPKD